MYACPSPLSLYKHTYKKGRGHQELKNMKKMENKVVRDRKLQEIKVREYDSEKDLKMVEKLERRCEAGSKEGFCFLSCAMDDPLCRIRHYTVHIIFVVEVVGNGEVVGVVRGCMKDVQNGIMAESNLKLGCILGLRVSPMHRRRGIGLMLVKSVEEWAIRNDANYLSVATDDNNMASLHMFIDKCNYVKANSLTIFAQPVVVGSMSEKTNNKKNIKIQKLSIEQSIDFYENRLRENTGFLPSDIDAILRQKLSLGTWVSYYSDQGQFQWVDEKTTRPRSWAITSIWNTCEAYKIEILGSGDHLRCFQGVVSRRMGSNSKSKSNSNSVGCLIPGCLEFQSFYDILDGPFGFLFLYGFHGEGDGIGDLTKALWCFSHNMAAKFKDCKALVTELGCCDPLRNHIPDLHGVSTYHIDDLWLFKKANCGNNDADQSGQTTGIQQHLPHALALPSLFVDPRDF
ncbi:hypothetical protein ZOSMA_3G00260 [Zostera marina]|uniref:N-acetyltransferase domain-containing protein n=1 Tax=Zostera marina TaxID=29655 RepID=A0A0K9P3I7_ZOSMR|nr:hypothetical protein ZOSMA_3G00260 [Zostera marina]